LHYRSVQRCESRVALKIDVRNLVHAALDLGQVKPKINGEDQVDIVLTHFYSFVLAVDFWDYLSTFFSLMPKIEIKSQIRHHKTLYTVLLYRVVQP